MTLNKIFKVLKSNGVFINSNVFRNESL